MGATETILSKTQPIVNVQIRKAKNRTVLISAQKYGGKYICAEEGESHTNFYLKDFYRNPLKTAESGKKKEGEGKHLSAAYE